MSKVMGHIFLRRLGKKRLRPGGKEATDFLLNHMQIRENQKILEVACNNGVNLEILSKKYPSTKFYGVDLDSRMIEEGVQRGLKNVEFIKANAAKLPFEDESFDYIINEAMLTMLPYNVKEKIIKEYFRVLKPNGLLLTHDICIINNEEKAIKILSNAINVNANPLTKEKWFNIFSHNGLNVIDSISDKLTLMTPSGMIKDEGIVGTLRIIKNGLKKENRPQFTAMRKTFMKLKNDIAYIAIVSKKN